MQVYSLLAMFVLSLLFLYLSYWDYTRNKADYVDELSTFSIGCLIASFCLGMIFCAWLISSVIIYLIGEYLN